MIVWINSGARERRGAVTERNVDTHGETVQRFRRLTRINSGARERRGAVTERNVDTHGETVQRFRSA
jgi:hypothetical protein